ncbi:hypothetical protein ACBJ59_35820 [Nonomuraea sp. MTCD27]|uniref:hypothetical protein n=1 Tax=Nonomuraea sp. MTCD27 TaxID=1676747 RepID=UPI0035C02D36
MLTSGQHQTLTVTDKASGDSVTLTPALLYRYRHSPTPASDEDAAPVEGLAALDADGLVLLDLPGDWYGPHLEELAQKAGIPLEDIGFRSSSKVRAALASRAPGWRRIRGLPLPSTATWRKPVAIGTAFAGVALMAYLASSGMWVAWRGIATIGRVLLDFLDAKWLFMAFSPALLLIRPARIKFHRLRVKRGLAVGPYGGPYLILGSFNKLHITRAGVVIADVRLGESPGRAFSLLLYRYEGLTGLFILDIKGRALHHLPGHWSPQDVEHFAKRHDLLLAVHRLSREEYLDLARNSREATP